MAYEILNRFVPESRYPIKASHPMDPQSITIHNTANDVSAPNEVAYMTRNNNYVSYHVAIDDKHAVQAIPFSRNAWHAGDGGSGKGNRTSIGIEICYSTARDSRYDRAEANAVEYVAHVLHQYGWGVDRVKWHHDWSGKNCPHRILDEGRAKKVRAAIAKRLQELKKPAAETAAKEEPEVEKEERYEPVSGSLGPEWEKAVEYGITDGSNPHEPATRVQVAAMILRAVKAQGK